MEIGHTEISERRVHEIRLARIFIYKLATKNLIHTIVLLSDNLDLVILSPVGNFLVPLLGKGCIVEIVTYGFNLIGFMYLFENLQVIPFEKIQLSPQASNLRR